MGTTIFSAFPPLDRGRRTRRHLGRPPSRTGLVIAGFAINSAFAGSEIDVYGRINVTLQDSDEAVEEQVELKSNASRVGVKGEKALNSDLKAIYQLEWGVNVDSESDDDIFTPRNQFVGLEGAFGTVKVGRHDTALKESQGDFDLFNDLEGDIAGILNGENRLKNYIGYTTPAFGKSFHATANFFPGEDPSSGNNGVADSGSLSLDYETDLLYVAVAHDWDIDGEGVETLRLVGGYTIGSARLMLLYQQTDTDFANEDGFGASLAWTFGKNTAKVQYLTADIWRTDPQADPLENLYESVFSVGSIANSERTPSCSGFTRQAISVGPAKATTSSPLASNTTSEARLRLQQFVLGPGEEVARIVPFAELVRRVAGSPVDLAAALHGRARIDGLGPATHMGVLVYLQEFGGTVVDRPER